MMMWQACSLSVVATHHLLTQLLLFLMGYLAHFEHGNPHTPICGSNYHFEEVRASYFLLLTTLLPSTAYYFTNVLATAGA